MRPPTATVPQPPNASSAARTSRCWVSLPLCPASSMMISRASGQARASSHAVPRGVDRSNRPWISTPGIPSKPARVAQQGALFEPGAVREVVRADPDQGLLVGGRALAERVRGAVRFHGQYGVLPGAPVGRGPLPDGGVGALHEAGVGGREGAGVVRIDVGFALRDARAEAFPLLGEDLPGAPVQPVGLRAPGRRDPGDDDLRDTLRVGLGVREDERRAPGTAVQEPAFDPETGAQPLHVRDEMAGGVVAQVGGGVARVRGAASAVALVEEDDAVALGVEEPPGARAAAGARTAVDDERGLALGIAADLPVDEVAVADVEHAVVVRLDGRVQGVGGFGFCSCSGHGGSLVRGVGSAPSL